MESVVIDSLVNGGQGLATMSDGRKVFVWGALPGETVKIRVIKKKRSYCEAIAEEVVEASPDRVEPREPNYLATSPWQIMPFNAENKAKKQIVGDLFKHEKVKLPPLGPVQTTDQEWNYRNKMEYSFWGDDDGIHLALHRRGSHGKEIVNGSHLAMKPIDIAANAILEELKKIDGLRAGDLKTVVIRCSQGGETVAALYVKAQKFAKLNLPSSLKGLKVYHSNPRSPASVATKLIYELGDSRLGDQILDKKFEYNVDSFFQVNLPVFEKALATIKSVLPDQSKLIDMYSGTGVIGLSVAKGEVDLVELDGPSSGMAKINAQDSGIKAHVIQASTEKVLDYITGEDVVVFDPPRAGLHDDVVKRVLEVKPPKIVYLSCNPATQARDLVKLQLGYTIEKFEIYNFFPKTPHIETLAVLNRL